MFMCDSTFPEEQPLKMINSGFFFFRSTPNILRMLDPQRLRTIVEHSSDGSGSNGGRVLNDQNYLRSQLVNDAILFDVLPLDMFANGNSWSASSGRIAGDVTIVHYTHPGQSKKAQMQAHGHWIVDMVSERGGKEELR
jgi:hypothetical protein